MKSAHQNWYMQWLCVAVKHAGSGSRGGLAVHTRRPPGTKGAGLASLFSRAYISVAIQTKTGMYVCVYVCNVCNVCNCMTITTAAREFALYYEHCIKSGSPLGQMA